MNDEEFKITVPDPPALEQVKALYLAGGRNALSSLIAKHILQNLEKGIWIILNGKAIPIYRAEKLQFADRSDIISTSPLPMEKVP